LLGAAPPVHEATCVSPLGIKKTGEKMIPNLCAYCRSSIVSGERWVREKIYDPATNGRDPNYHRYHAEPFAGQEESCWEKHQMQQEIARTTAFAA
jgi:hypothetical protein